MKEEGRDKDRREEKEKERERRKREREKQITVAAGPFWRINYSYRRAFAAKLILHYITVEPSPGIRNVIIIAAMVDFPWTVYHHSI